MSEKHIFSRLFFLAILFSAGCVQKPTAVSQSYPVIINTDLTSLKRVLRDESYALVDVRSPLSYQSRSHSGSVPMWWEDETMRSGEPLRRHFDEPQKIANRWALRGLEPKKPVILIHEGAEKNESKIALCLFQQFGFTQIFQVSMKDIRSLIGSAETHIAESPAWKVPEQVNLKKCEPEALNNGASMDRSQATLPEFSL